LALREAAKAGKIENITYLLTRVRDNAWVCKGEVLELVVKGRHLGLVRDLVEPTVTNHALCKYAGQSLEYAVKNGLHDYIPVLLTGIKNKSKQSKVNAINLAMEHMQVQSLKLLLAKDHVFKIAHLCDIALLQNIKDRADNESDSKRAECQAIAESLSMPRVQLMLHVFNQDMPALQDMLKQTNFKKRNVSLVSASLLAIKLGNMEVIKDFFVRYLLDAATLFAVLKKAIPGDCPDFIREINSVILARVNVNQKVKFLEIALLSKSYASLDVLMERCFSKLPDKERLDFLDKSVRSGNNHGIDRLIKYCNNAEAKHMYRVYADYVVRYNIRLTDSVKATLENLIDSASTVSNIPIRKFILDKEVWSRPECVEKILNVSNESELLQLLYSESWVTRSQILALKLLAFPILLESLEKSRAALVQGNVDDDRNVARATLHFNTIVQPYFEAAFNNFGSTDIERVDAIECKIRELILDYILKESNPSAEMVEFISENRENLIQGESAALAASVPHFIGSDSGFSAWRSYNPHSPIGRPGFSNLLTPQQGDAVAVFTTPAATSNLEVVDNHTTSSLLRLRMAYYYLAVTDDSISPESISNRIANFVNKLSEIRNAKGINFVSCFPGHVTRIGEAGNFHPVAELPPSYSVLLESFFKAHIVSNFKNALSQCRTAEEREHLFYAVISFSMQSVEDFLYGKEVFSEQYFWSRLNFIESLGEAELLLIQFGVETPGLKLTDEDIVYFEQYLADPTLGSIGNALTECYRNFGNMPATSLQIEEANPFKVKNSKESEVFNILVKFGLQHIPEITVTHLESLSDYIKDRTEHIVKQKGFTRQFLLAVISQIADIDIESAFEGIQSALNGLGYHVIHENPYTVQLQALSLQLVRMAIQPLFRQALEARVEKLKVKVNLFNDFSLVHPDFNEVEIEGLVETEFDRLADEPSENNALSDGVADPKKVNRP